ncbi:MAG TPA: aminotransferase class IV [Pseudolysinimonas sp.]|nr:aminotransferase class IV [Pseudolysinimonas sp.]
MSAATVSLWREDSLEPRDDCDVLPATIEVADSWLVADGTVRGLELHRMRFLTSIPRARYLQVNPDAFWNAAIAAIPRAGMWFPRVELRLQLLAPQLLFRLREAPKLRRSVTLATHTSRDPRTAPRFKGPDLEAMTRLRTLAQKRGADEAVLLSAEGWIAEGSTTSLAWWRGDALCVPSNDIERVDGVTIRSVITLATALGVDVLYETVTPGELQGLEVWALNALHGIRIVTAWIDGPATAELPGRLATWQARLDALRKPLPSGLA